MLESIKVLLRKNALKRSASHEPTGITPLRRLRSAVVFIDVEDSSFDLCKREIMSFFRDNGIKGEIFFFDFRKLTEGERLITSITNTILRKDLNWYGRPPKEKVDLMLSGEPDLFISLVDNDSFAIEYMTRCSQAHFKIGRRQLPGDVFDLVVSDPTELHCEAEVFREMAALLRKIK